MYDKCNFIRSSAGIFFILFSLHLESKEFTYKFKWLSLPVASLSVEFDDLTYANNDIRSYTTNFRLSTQGPLGLYREYSSQGYIKYDADISWDYYLSGNDRGQPEEKHITYFYDMAPNIRKFIDDSGVSPIIIDPELDKNAIDPFSVLFRTIDQLKSKQQCQNEFTVMDGKRRYEIIVNLEEKIVDLEKKKNEIQNIIYFCKFTFSYLREEKRKWPFNKKNRYLDVWFSSKLGYKPIRFYTKTPIGSIVGDYVIDKQR